MNASDSKKTPSPRSQNTRSRILSVAAKIVKESGPDAATTRVVSDAANVQPPAIYRLFGDKQGLLDAVAEHALNVYVTEKSARHPNPDPIQELRAGWNLHVAFCLENPGVFAILNGLQQDHATSAAVTAAHQVLRQRVRNIALNGQLRVSEEHALNLLRSVGTGTVLTLLERPAASRDLQLSDTALEAVISIITGEPVIVGKLGANTAAATLQVFMPEVDVLSDGERQLLGELLVRIAGS